MKNRHIAYITYDSNGNPGKIYFTNGSVTKYKYSATGQKLGVEYYVAAPNVTVAFGAEPDALTLGQTLFAGSTQYLLGGSLVMKDGLINKFLFDGGYAQATAANPTTYSFSFYYYNQDHLGNNREVVDASGTVRQVTNYYPFGTPYTESSAVMDASLQPYKYNGKELDRMHGLNTYDYGARQYNPVLGRWDRMDPLCEKYYDVSPYGYCGNNPVNAIDPDGRDEWEINKQGEIIKKIKTKQHDAFFILGDDNKRIIDKSISFKYGTITKSFKSHTNDGDKYDVYQMRGDANGEKLYNFLADNTSVEWSHAQFGIKGNKGLNFIITSHKISEEGGLSNLISKQLMYGYFLRNTSHSHPGKTRFPSGLEDRNADIGFARDVQDIFGNNVNFSIYIPNENEYIPYNSDSKIEDFIEALPTINLEEIIKTP